MQTLFAGVLSNCRSGIIRDESAARTHRTPKHFVRNEWKLRCYVLRKLWECARVLASLFESPSGEVFVALRTHRQLAVAQ
jgi:hypothetical protein